MCSNLLRIMIYKILKITLLGHRCALLLLYHIIVENGRAERENFDKAPEIIPGCNNKLIYLECHKHFNYCTTVRK